MVLELVTKSTQAALNPATDEALLAILDSEELDSDALELEILDALETKLLETAELDCISLEATPVDEETLAFEELEIIWLLDELLSEAVSIEEAASDDWLLIESLLEVGACCWLEAWLDSLVAALETGKLLEDCEPPAPLPPPPQALRALRVKIILRAFTLLKIVIGHQKVG